MVEQKHVLFTGCLLDPGLRHLGDFALAPETQRRDAEYGLAASNAAETVDWQVWSPVGLDEDWTPSTVTFGQRADVPETLRMGWITPEQEYIESRQAENPTQAWVDEVVLPGMDAQEPISIDGPNGTTAWQLSTGFDDNEVPVSALVLEPSGDQSATTIVSGTASIPELLTYIEALETP
ncbi:DUF4245 family protein [Ornithinimicrobium sp. INDO-MA30-4]|uniref:DUF4245 family protein n=1 Tax=Ornithinimicrobium sp. INDO-MA30-4 TaxID=2908651 RepID=UPI001F4127C3|nr:DUF4245 family protein [Ornithinimicrobium sp. INDO-MA30-4]UJH69414.1 DUF4245 domain-containing protein [Ornithinimicrobium sp. INDO-MA30-4]